jgi:hypothetical protein
VPIAFVSGEVRNFSVAFPARGELTEDVAGRGVVDYILPGVTSGYPTVAAMFDTLPPRFRVFGSDGQETGTLSTTTHPTQATYEAMIVGGQEIIASASLRRWRGNIWEREIRLAKAR